MHIGTPERGDRIASQRATTLQRATDLTMQVHSIDPPHPYILRSIELFAEKVAPAQLGCGAAAGRSGDEKEYAWKPM